MNTVVEAKSEGKLLSEVLVSREGGGVVTIDVLSLTSPIRVRVWEGAESDPVKRAPPPPGRGKRHPEAGDFWRSRGSKGRPTRLIKIHHVFTKNGSIYVTPGSVQRPGSKSTKKTIKKAISLKNLWDEYVYVSTEEGHGTSCPCGK